jgi:dihydropteroate synthase
MSRLMVRYRVRPECAELNERLVREVFEELAAAAPEGLSYESMVLDDGVTFVHVVEGDNTALRELPAFQRFAWTVGDRCEDPPQQSTVRVIGSFEGRTS